MATCLKGKLTSSLSGCTVESNCQMMITLFELKMFWKKYVELINGVVVN